MTITEHIAAVRREMAEAARESGRSERDIILVGASKMNDDAACQEAIAAGVDALGENRVQEMTAKLAQNAYDGAPLHFIGHLQRNKVRQVVGKAALIQSIGSEALLREETEAASVLARELPHVRVRGLMTIPPVETVPHGNLVYFEKMHRLYVDINGKTYDNELEYISMGMSGDFADAIRVGSNMVRVGTAIFGARDYTK